MPTLIKFIRIGIFIRLWCLSALIGLIVPASAQAARLIDAQVMSALLAGQEQRVVIQYKDVVDTKGAEDDQQRRGRRSALKARALSGLKATHFKAHRDFSELPMSSMTLTAPEALTALLADPNVEAIFADKPLKAHMVEALPLIGQPPVVNAMGRVGTGVAMAILDTGVDYTRSEFGACTAPGTPVATCRVVATYEAATNDNALDSNGHGTEVAMAAAAVAPGAKIVAVDVFNGDSAYSADIVAGINWVISNRGAYNIGVINLSLGDAIEHTSACGASDLFYSAISAARDTYGIIVVAAAGNSGYSNGISSPACVSAAVAVGAVYDANVNTLGWNLSKYDSTKGAYTVTCWDNTTAADLVTCFSSSGSMLDVLAPGAMITVGGHDVAGTSIAAPFVTAAVAILRAQYPGESVSKIEARITSTGKAITDPRNGLVKPRLNLLAAQGAPSNDNLTAAASLSGSSGAVSSWNYNATAQSGEPAHAGQAASHSVWWTWTAPASGTLTLNTQGSSIDTVLAVYSGTSITALTALASSDDGVSSTQSELSMAVTAGQTYKIAVDGKNGATGALNLNWSRTDIAYAVNLSVNLEFPATAAVGDLLTLNASIRNAGPQAASSTQLAVTLPSGLTLANAPVGCTVSASTVTCAAGNLAASSISVWTFDVNAVSTGARQITVTVSSSVPETSPADNTAQASIDVQQVATPTTSNDGGDVPLPGWALGGLAAALWQLQRRRSARAPAP
jgi:uncharacterized repeat protein (TIGR01451 family)